MAHAKPIIACCGLTCTECDAYKATQEKDVTLAKKTAAAWSAQFHVDVKVDDVWCDGCTVPGRKCAHCGECEIRACAQKRSLANCAACADYPSCKIIGGFFAMVPQAKQALDALRPA